MQLVKFRRFQGFVHFTNCPRAFGRHCILRECLDTKDARTSTFYLTEINFDT